MIETGLAGVSLESRNQAETELTTKIDSSVAMDSGTILVPNLWKARVRMFDVVRFPNSGTL